MEIMCSLTVTDVSLAQWCLCPAQVKLLRGVCGSGFALFLASFPFMGFEFNWPQYT